MGIHLGMPVGNDIVRDRFKFFIPNGSISSPVTLLNTNLEGFTDMIKFLPVEYKKEMMLLLSQIQWSLC